ncbi:MAG: 4Fe-4S binding protein [Bacteroidota bacterium]
MNIFKYITNIIDAVISLIKGLKITGNYFIHPNEIVTQRYPENRKKLKMFERFRGEVVMIFDEKKESLCGGCGICETQCPNGSLKVIPKTIVTSDDKKKRVIDKLTYHLSMCTFCGLCIKMCPQTALTFSQEFEHAVFNKKKLTKILNEPEESATKKIKIQ